MLLQRSCHIGPYKNPGSNRKTEHYNNHKHYTLQHSEIQEIASLRKIGHCNNQNSMTLEQ